MRELAGADIEGASGEAFLPAYYRRIHFADRCHDIVGVFLRILRIQRDTGKSAEDVEGLWAAGGPVADGLASLGVE